MSAKPSAAAWDSLKTPEGVAAMITSDVLAQALPGRENAKDWLTMKIVECMASPMDEQTAGKLSAYNGAYNAICQWNEDEQVKKKPSSSSESMSLETAKEWTKHMQNEDGTSGEHWSVEQAKQIMAQRNLSLNPAEFYAALNLIYSDFSPVVKKHGLGGSMDFYVDMAKAFLNDKDAAPNKLSNYYNHIVK